MKNLHLKNLIQKSHPLIILQKLNDENYCYYYHDLYIYDKIKDIIKETIIALKKLQVLEFDDKILK